MRASHKNKMEPAKQAVIKKQNGNSKNVTADMAVTSVPPLNGNTKDGVPSAFSFCVVIP